MCFDHFEIPNSLIGTPDIPYKNPYFSVTTEPNQMEFSPRCIYLFYSPRAYLKERFSSELEGASAVK